MGSLKIPPGHIWLITECGSGLGRALATRLKKQGQKSVVLQFPGLFSLASITGGKEIDMMTLNMTAEDHLERTLKNIESQFGTIAGLIHAHPLPKVAVSVDDFFPAAEMELVQVVYFLAKHLKTSLNQGYFVIVTQVDGQLATSRQQAYSVMGSGLSGLVKSFQRESINTHCRFLDLDPGLDMDDAVSIVLEEIADPDKSSIEVGRIRKQRLTLGLETTETSLSPLEKPDAKSVFLVSGGGRGITADCVIELAKAYGCKFILLGRTLLSASEPLWAEGCTEPDALRQNLIKDLKRKGEILTPVEINKMLSSLSSQREIRHTLEEVKGAGGEAVYQCVDITDKASLQGVLSPIIQSWGHITGVIHGAGNLADKRLEKKTLADWQRVVTPKIIGLQNLLSVLDVARLKYLILFSSVSAYFGNAGQTDYALANEILNKFAYSCQSLYPGLQVTSINWGPWEKGMMNSVLQKYYQAQGIELISVATGTRLLREELEIGQTHRSQQILISGSLSLPDNYYTRRQEESSYLRDLQAVYNPFLNDHKVGDELVLPLTCAINWMVKNCENQLPNYQARVIEDFQVLKGIRLAKSSQCSCVSSVKPIDKRDDYLGYELQINTLNQDKPIALPRYKGKIFLSNHWENLPLYNNLELQVSLDKRVEKLYGDRACLFHGKTFQGVRQVLRINEGKITSLCCLDDVARDEQGQFAVNSFNPYVADVQLHNVLIWTYVYLEQGCLPMGVEKIEQFQPLNFDQEFYVSTEIVMRNQFKVVVDIYAHDQQGQIYMKWSRVYCTLMNKLSTLFWDKEVKAV